MKDILNGVVGALATLLAAGAAQAADIKVVATEVREHGVTKIPAVIRVKESSVTPRTTQSTTRRTE